MINFYKKSDGSFILNNRTTTPYPATMCIDAYDIVHIEPISGNIQAHHVAIGDIKKEDGSAYADYETLETAVSGFFVNALSEGASPITRVVHIDANRTDSYTANGSVTYPFKTFAEAIDIMEVGTSYAIYLAPGNYSAGTVNLPACPFTLYGNKSTLTVTSLTLNESHAIYDLNTIGTINYAYMGASRSTRMGGSLNGAVNISGGFPHFENLNYSGLMTITGGNPYFRGLTGGGRIVLNGEDVILSVSDANMDNNLAVSNITVTLGQLIVNGARFTNNNTVPQIALNNTNTAAKAHALSGVLANYVTCGNAYTILAPDCAIVAMTGNLIIPSQASMFATGVGGGTAQAQTATVPMLSQALFAGLRVTYFASVSNTGAAPAINVNGLGAKTVIRGIKASTGTALVANDILAGMAVDILYNGTNWLLMNPQT